VSSAFLGGARDRLLPVSIPFRFFVSAALFHLAAWGVLLLEADQLGGFTGGPGPILAAIHLATLGVFAMTAIGASYQLLPVVTRRPLARDWPTRLSFWLLSPGICLLAWGMDRSSPGAMQTGAALVCSGLTVFAMLTADNLRRAGSVAVVAAHGWAALLALVGLAVLGMLLVWDFQTGFLDDHAGLAVIHMVLASYGFMGLLVAGFSLVLVPMFALSRSLPQRPGWAQLVLAGLALASFACGRWTGNTAFNWLALLAGFGAAGTYLWLMRAAMARRMRKRLGLSFVLIRASWGLLGISLILGAALLADLPIPNAPALFGFLLLAGWLSTFLMGILQRIMPFLASMHASGKSGLPPPPSDLTPQTPLKIHAFCHFGALACCAAGIIMETTALIRLGAVFGCVGALAFVGFALIVLLRLRAFQQGS